MTSSPTSNPIQCTSTMVQTINAPLPRVWSILRRFDQPHVYKNFIRDCTMTVGDGGVGSVREVEFVTGVPGKWSRERLEKLDEDTHAMVYCVIDGDQRLKNYRSTTTVHEAKGGRASVVIESYVVEVPEGNTGEETIFFVDTIVGCNLRGLSDLSENYN